MLEEALERLTKNEVGRALDMLVKAWDASPIPRLGDLIDTIDARLPKAAVDGKSHEAWLALASSGKSTDLGALLATLCSGTLQETAKRITALKVFGRDPRIASALFKVVREVPFTSNGSRPTWLVIFERLGELEDPRVMAGMDAAKSGWGIRANQREWLEPRVDALVARLRKRFPHGIPEPDGKTAKALSELEAALTKSAVKPKTGVGARTGGDLLHEIYQSPDDDQPRSVYADWLQERGDPRGEFIALQLQREKTKAMLKRESALLKEHERAWLGELEPVVNKKGTEFERGFLSECQVRFKNERDVRAHGSHASWATVRKLTHALPGSPPVDQVRWLTFIDPAMKSLRDVSVFPESLTDLCSASEPWLIERIRWGAWQSRDMDADAFELLAKTDKLPQLEALVLRDIPKGIWLASAHFAKRLRDLEIVQAFGPHFAESVGPLLAATKVLPKLARLVLNIAWKQDLTFSRDAKGAYSIARAEIDPLRLWDLTGVLDAMPVGLLTELTITRAKGDARVVDKVRLRTLLEAAARHGLVRLDTDGLL